MSETIPPLPELPIHKTTGWYTDQKTVDHALALVYEHMPEVFKTIAERNRANQDLIEIGNKIVQFLSTLKIGENSPAPHLVKSTIFGEARRRANVMYRLLE